MMRATLSLLVALCRLASADDCALDHEKVCMEACYPNEGENVDEDCCAERKYAYCAEGYRLIKNNQECYEQGEIVAYKTCCVPCDGAGEDGCDNGPGDEWLENEDNECPDHVLRFIIWILFVIIFITLCGCSWTYVVLTLCNYPKLGSGEPLCCANCCSPPVWFKINIGLALSNLILFIILCFVEAPWWPDLVCYLFMMIATAVAAGLLKSKQASWDRANAGHVVDGRPVQMGSVVVGQPPMAQVVVGRSLPVGKP